MVRRSQKTKNRMIDEVHWMQRKCAEIEKKEGQVGENLRIIKNHKNILLIRGENWRRCQQGGCPGPDPATRRQHEVRSVRAQYFFRDFLTDTFSVSGLVQKLLTSSVELRGWM